MVDLAYAVTFYSMYMYVCTYVCSRYLFYFIKVARYKRDRSYDGDDDASSLDEAAPKRRKLSPLVTSASTSTTSVCYTLE